jgi:hypothetical protein
MSKMGLQDPFRNLKHKLWPKEGSGIARFPCVQVACQILLERFRQGLQVCLDLISIEGLHAKLWAFKVVGVPTLGISGLLGQNDIWVLVLWPSTEYTTRGKVVASPKFGPW